MLKSNSVIYYTKMLPYCPFQDSVSSGSADEVNTQRSSEPFRIVLSNFPSFDL